MRAVDPARLVFVDESSMNVAMVAHYARAPGGERAYRKAPRNWSKNVTFVSSLTLSGMGLCKSIEGSVDSESFGLYLREALCQSLEPGRIVVTDNLSVYKGREVRDLVEERGCQLRFLPPYLPELNPIEEAFSKVKGILEKAKARTFDALFEAKGVASLGRGRGRRPRLLLPLRVRTDTRSHIMRTVLG
jgi:transposase